MQTAIHLTRDQVPQSLIGGYRGNMFRVIVAETVHIPSNAGLWDGGSRDVFVARRMADGFDVPFPGQDTAPWDRGRQDRTVTLRPGIAVVEHSHFCGKDMGLRIYVHPTDAAPMLPSKAELAPLERAVLEYTAGRKSSYNGQDRCAQLQSDMRTQLRYGYGGLAYLDFVPSREQWDGAKSGLIARGLLNKAGAITVAGRNARNG